MNDLPESEKSSSPTSSAPLTIKDYREAYQRADRFCKEVQNYVDAAGIPAINEMRYAGYHLLSALSDDGAITDQNQLVKAHNHVLRAAYEASEAGILVALSDIADVKLTFNTIVISEVVSNWRDILADAEEAKNRIEIRKNGTGELESELDEFMALFGKLKKHCQSLSLHRDELNKKKRKDKTDTRRFLLSMAAAAVAIVLSVVAWLFPRSPASPTPTSTSAVVLSGMSAASH